MVRFKQYFFLFTLLLSIGALEVAAQQADSWEQVQQNKRGTVTALWYDIDPFIFKDKNGALQGVEYELMHAFTRWLKEKYGYEVAISWKNASSFENIYEQVKQAKASGLFGWSFFSITPERQAEVRFTPPYMPDMNVLVTNDALPLYNNKDAFADTLSSLQGYTMRHTAMEADIDALIRGRQVPVSREYDDYEILRKISENPNGFGYVPLTVYVVSLQKGIKVKRQHLFATEREGLAGIFPKNSDWQPVVNQYFQSFECKRVVAKLLSKYLGSETGEIIMEGVGTSPDEQRSAELELLAKEREIISQRLVDTLLAAEHDKMLRNISILAVIVVVVITVLVYNRYRIKTRLSDLLIQKNTLIRKQNRDIERINRKLHMRVLQAQVNPHFVFNSLNDLQYFINKGDKEASLAYVSRFSRFIRELLSQANDPEITLAQEEQFMKLYLELEKIRFTGRFDYVLETAPDLPAGLSGLPPLILYHYVENALYHGILNSEGKGEIRIFFQYQSPYLVCTITDNGCGREKTKALYDKRGQNDTTPYSKLLQERIDMLNDEVSDRIAVHVEDLVTPDGKRAGTRVTIRILVSSRKQNPVVLDY
ncbi:histidine kinase [Chitinophaga japonensis]|uniref:Extracellular solute-binding protein (Family 3) n=1 Tax=Chitinophaga japonensis TaxID=104662 RepID=A0A562SZF4_CHIJA|nr:histidine kinase [Chitinophaga japonensis]TWI86384.1 extracellular solute-binding protein (family 3) [Chitinophaga japonensis]